MTKTEFLEYLEKRLHVLKDKEREDILSEYAQHIELKMQSGLSEEDAIHDFGGLEELAAEILDAYNVNPDYDKRQFPMNGGSIKKGFTRFKTRAGSLWRRGVSHVAGLFHTEPGSRAQRIQKCCLIIAALAIVYLPLLPFILFISDCLYLALNFPFDRVISVAAIVLFHLGYLLVMLWAVYRFALKADQPKAESAKKESLPADPTASESDKKPWPGIKNVFSSAAKGIKHLLTLPGFTKRERPAKTKGAGYYMKMLLWILKNTFIFVLKVAAVCVLTPVLLAMLVLIAVFGALLVLTFLGYPVVGLAILALGVLLSGSAFLWLVSSVLFAKKVREEA